MDHLQLVPLISLILYILYKEGLTKFLTSRHSSSPSPEKEANELMVFEISKAVRDAINENFKPIMESQTRILERIAETQQTLAIDVARLLERGL